MKSTNITDKAVEASGGIEPEFFRLPSSGHDKHFGLTRSFYYAAEARGWIRLKRLRERGKLRGITLVPYKEVRDFLNREETTNERGGVQ